MKRFSLILLMIILAFCVFADEIATTEDKDTEQTGKQEVSESAKKAPIPCGGPVVFYRMSGEAWKCAGGIMKNANGNIFDGVVYLGELKGDLELVIGNFKEETDYMDTVILLNEFPLKDEKAVKFYESAFGKPVSVKEKDNRFYILAKGGILRLPKTQVSGKTWVKISGFYTSPLSEAEEKQREDLMNQFLKWK